MPSHVSAIPAADPRATDRRFESRLQFETDCWDVHAAMSNGHKDFVLLDVRSPDAYRKGHIPGAIKLSHAVVTCGKLQCAQASAVGASHREGQPGANGESREERHKTPESGGRDI